MDPGAPFRKELRHRTRWIAGLEQLDVHAAEAQANDRGAVGGFGRARGKSQDVAGKRESLRDAAYGDAHVSDGNFPRHGQLNDWQKRKGGMEGTPSQPVALT